MNKILLFLKRYHIHIDRNILSYGMCVIIATILWFLNALNKDYVSEISYPIKYTDFPKGKYLVSDLPKVLSLEVKAKGFALLGYRISTSFQPIVIDITAYSNHMLEKNNVYEYTVKTNEIKDKLNTQLSSDIKLLNVRPEEIDFKFSPTVSRTMPIRPVVDYSLKNQYILKNSISVQPDSILVSGPALIVDTLQCIYTTPWKLGEISKDAGKIVPLAEMQGVSFEETDVKINVYIERFTEAQRSVPISVKNLPDSLTIKLFPEYVDITYEIGLSMYDKINDSDFNFTIDYRKNENQTYLSVKIERAPSFIKNLTYTPQKVEYILEKK